MYKYIYTLLFFLAAGAGCRQKIAEGNFDQVVWKEDHMGCKGNRQRLVPAFQEMRPQLVGRSPREVMGLLGKPEAEEIRAGSERVFFYFLESGPQCDRKGLPSSANKVQVRFNALNQVSEVSYSQPIGNLLRP